MTLPGEQGAEAPDLTPYAQKNRAMWEATSDAYEARNADALSGENAMAWGLWRIPEGELRMRASPPDTLVGDRIVAWAVYHADATATARPGSAVPQVSRPARDPSVPPAAGLACDPSVPPDSDPACVCDLPTDLQIVLRNTLACRLMYR